MGGCDLEDINKNYTITLSNRIPKGYWKFWTKLIDIQHGINFIKNSDKLKSNSRFYIYASHKDNIFELHVDKRKWKSLRKP